MRRQKSLQQNLQKLEAAETQVLGVSMDRPYASKALADQIGVTLPLSSDWRREVTRKYSLYADEFKAARRARAGGCPDIVPTKSPFSVSLANEDTPWANASNAAGGKIVSTCTLFCDTAMSFASKLA